MRQLTCTGPGVLEWIDVAEPELREATDVLVRPVAVARCELDPLLVVVGPRDDVPFAVGHERLVPAGPDRPSSGRCAPRPRRGPCTACRSTAPSRR